MSRSKNVGTAAETAVVTYLRNHGFPHAERRALAGTHDLGDITGTPGIVWEIKSIINGRGAYPSWMRETETERLNAGNADLGILVVKPAGLGDRNIDRWHTVTPLPVLESLLTLSAANPLPAETIRSGNCSHYRAWLRAIEPIAPTPRPTYLRIHPRGIAKDETASWWAMCTLATMTQILHTCGYGTQTREAQS